MTLTKMDIVEKFYSDLELPKAKSMDLVETVLEKIKSTLECGEDVLITGFGKFCVQTKGGRRASDPATGKDLMLRPRKRIQFKCSGKLRKQINGKG